MAMRGPATLKDIRALADHRYHIRRFFRACQPALKAAKLQPSQYEVLLQIKAAPIGTKCTIGYVAERLQITHHGAVQLVDRMSYRALVRRKRDGEDRRQVLLQLTKKGEIVLRGLTLQQSIELRYEARNLVTALSKLIGKA